MSHGSIYWYSHLKLEAFSIFPPWYTGTAGYAHNGLVRFGFQSDGTSGLSGFTVAVTESGSIPRSTQSTRA